MHENEDITTNVQAADAQHPHEGADLVEADAPANEIANGRYRSLHQGGILGLREAHTKDPTTDLALMRVQCVLERKTARTAACSFTQCNVREE